VVGKGGELTVDVWLRAFEWHLGIDECLVKREEDNG
jgi:hypothetical protein